MQAKVKANSRHTPSRSNSSTSSKDALSKREFGTDVEALLSLIDERLRSEKGHLNRSVSSNIGNTDCQEMPQSQLGLPAALFSFIEQDAKPDKEHIRRIGAPPYQSVPNLSSVLKIDHDVISPRSKRLKGMALNYRSVPDLSSALQLPIDNAPILPRRRLSSDPDLSPAINMQKENRLRRHSAKSNVAVVGKNRKVFIRKNRQEGRIPFEGKMLAFTNLADDESSHSDLTKTDRDDDSDEGNRKGLRSYKMTLAGPHKYTRKLPQENHPLKQEIWPNKAKFDQSLPRKDALLQDERWTNSPHSYLASPSHDKQQSYVKRTKSIGEENDLLVKNIVYLRTPRGTGKDKSIEEFYSPLPATSRERRWSEKDIDLRGLGSEILRTPRRSECGANMPEQQQREGARIFGDKKRLESAM